MIVSSDWQQLETKLIARAWEDAAFKALLLKDARAAFQQAGLAYPEGLEVKVVEQAAGLQIKETPGVRLVLLPPKPAAPAHAELSDHDLDLVAGGALGPTKSATDCPATTRCVP